MVQKKKLVLHYMPRGPGITQRKILLLLLGGAVLSFNRSPRRQRYILRLIGKEWKALNREKLWDSIRSLYQSKLALGNYNPNGSVTLILTESGKKRALTYQLDEMKIKRMKKWDGRWRLVAFDIPEHLKKAREAIRMQFERMGMMRFQKSIFISPYPCNEEVDFVIEMFQLRPFVRKFIAEFIDNELHYKVKFHLVK